MVDGSGPGALGGAGLRLGAAGGEGGRVPQACRAAAGLPRGQTVHDAGETLQAGGAGALFSRNLCRQQLGTSLDPGGTFNQGSGTWRTCGGSHRSWHTSTRCCRPRSSAATPDWWRQPASKADSRFSLQSPPSSAKVGPKQRRRRAAEERQQPREHLRRDSKSQIPASLVSLPAQRQSGGVHAVPLRRGESIV